MARPRHRLRITVVYPWLCCRTGGARAPLTPKFSNWIDPLSVHPDSSLSQRHRSRNPSSALKMLSEEKAAESSRFNKPGITEGKLYLYCRQFRRIFPDGVGRGNSFLRHQEWKSNSHRVRRLTIIRRPLSDWCTYLWWEITAEDLWRCLGSKLTPDSLPPLHCKFGPMKFLLNISKQTTIAVWSTLGGPKLRCSNTELDAVVATSWPVLPVSGNQFLCKVILTVDNSQDFPQVIFIIRW